MPNWNLTEIICVLDRSGSMHPLADDVIGGYNQFIEEQRQQPGEANVTLVVFDTRSVMVYQSRPLCRVPLLSRVDYCPDGYTALHETLCLTIDNCGREFARRPEHQKPGKVLMLIMTDGKENASGAMFTKAGVIERIERQRQFWNWQFVFSGANIDAFAEGHGLGIDLANIAQYVPTSEGVRWAFSNMSQATRCYRSGGDATLQAHPS